MSTSLSAFKTRDRLLSVEDLIQRGRGHLRGLPVSNFAITTFAFAALLISSYLTWSKLTASKVVGCGSGGVIDCGHVLTTKWSMILGIPVGACAAVLYAVVLSALLVRRFSNSVRTLKVANMAIVTMGFSAGLAAIWFLSLQVFAIGHLCPWCMAAHFCGLGIAATLLWSRPLGVRIPRAAFVLAVAGTSMLITGQVLADPPPTYEVQTFGTEVSSPAAGVDDSPKVAPGQSGVFEAPVFAAPVFEAPAPVSVENEKPSDADFSSFDETRRTRAGDTRSELHHAAIPPLLAILVFSLMFQSGLINSLKADETTPEASETSPPAKKSRQVSLAGKALLNVADWPLAGSQDAKYIFVEMFDYTCPHCRSTHQTALKELKRHYGKDVAIVALPVPLNASCNKAVQTTSAAHIDACELAELAVAVWLADRDKFTGFHDWLFDGPGTRTVAEARQKAIELVGAEKLQKMKSTPTCKQYIQRHVDLYHLVGAGSVPKLLFNDTALVGTVSSADAVVTILERQSR
ncbi:MAG: thioredoxin domain-containing protein [Rhodopirellula sp.]|nr:thioredoxin domain-containing protein [Rhodopirellula sp.]